MKKTTRKRKRSNQNNAVNQNDGIKAYFIAASKSDEEMENEPNEVNDENNSHIDLDIKMIGTKTKKNRIRRESK